MYRKTVRAVSCGGHSISSVLGQAFSQRGGRSNFRLLPQQLCWNLPLLQDLMNSTCRMQLQREQYAMMMMATLHKNCFVLTQCTASMQIQFGLDILIDFEAC